MMMMQSPSGPSAYPCSMTHEGLEHYLVQSGYGANAAIFSCYFVRDYPTSPPLCATCRRTIGEHPSGGTAVAVPVQVAVATVAPSNALPLGLTVHDTHDEFETSSAAGRGFAVIVLVIFIGIEAAVFASTGVSSVAPYVWIVPALLMLLVLYLIWKPMLAKVLFHKGQGPQSAVTITRKRLFGCETTEQSTVAEFGQVGFRETRHKRSITFSVHAVSASGDDTNLYSSSSYVDAVAQYNAWRAYFALYGIAPHPELIPTVPVVTVFSASPTPVHHV